MISVCCFKSIIFLDILIIFFLNSVINIILFYLFRLCFGSNKTIMVLIWRLYMGLPFKDTFLRYPSSLVSKNEMKISNWSIPIRVGCIMIMYKMFVGDPLTHYMWYSFLEIIRLITLKDNISSCFDHLVIWMHCSCLNCNNTCFLY